MHDWDALTYFSKEGDVWSEDPDKYASVSLLQSINAYRSLLGSSVVPSPSTGALARFDDDHKVSKTSQHYVGGYRNGNRPIIQKSNALDVFAMADIRKAYTAALTSRLFGGIGVYFDTEYKNIPRCMLHIDLRNTEQTVVWFRQNGKYYYPLRSFADMKRFYELLNND